MRKGLKKVLAPSLQRIPESFRRLLYLLRWSEGATEDFKRKLTTSFITDVLGYNRLIGDGEEATVSLFF
jgi:hypothetical protein